MFALLLALPAVLLVVMAWIAYRRIPEAKMLCMTIIFSIGYWYILPGTLFLLGGEVAAVDADLLSNSKDITVAILLVHSSFVLLLLLPALFFSVPYRQHRWPPKLNKNLSLGRLDILLAITLISSLVYLTQRFAELGPAFVVQLLVGLTTAREFMTFENFSTGPTQSLLALWDIVNIFLSIFLASTLTWQRRAMSIRFACAAAAAMFSFVSSGSRTVLLLFLFAVVMALVCRPRATGVAVLGRTFKLSLQSAVSLVLMCGVIAISAVAMLARFQDDPSQSDSLALNSVGSHNDMFRELIFVLHNGWAYRCDPVTFLQTPITYAMPAFLGFNKYITPHLIDFNMDRAGIDLINGEGNVFPGLIADMYMCFGFFAPIVLSLFVAMMFAICLVATAARENNMMDKGLLIVLLCYQIISFRNLQGAFGILVVLAILLSALMQLNFKVFVSQKFRDPK